MNSELFLIESKHIWVCGHRGMVGSALMRHLSSEHCARLTPKRRTRDLRRQADVLAWLKRHPPGAIIVASPDRMPCKCLDGACLAARGWRPLKDGIDRAYRYFLDHIASAACAEDAPETAVPHHA